MFSCMICTALPTDMLGGHRSRFYKQFVQLQQFYNNTRNLQYFKGLIQVPALPKVMLPAIYCQLKENYLPRISPCV